MAHQSMKLADVVTALRAAAPEHLAQAWDKVGLQVGAPTQAVSAALLCIDLDEAVLAEALAESCQLIVAYHPPIFRPLAQLTDATWKERVLVTAVRHGIAIYSPHTALDNVAGGMTDWLCSGLGAHGSRAAILPSPAPEPASASASEPVPMGAEVTGSGRIVHLRERVLPDELVARVKAHLGLSHVKVAMRTEPVHSIAVCPGAGGSLFEQTPAVDAYITGEMQHHQVLDMRARGHMVILTGHSNSERPYLPHYRQRVIDAGAGEVEWKISAADTAPCRVM